jgi:RNA ligase (TIGR02306 family)
MLPLDDPRYEFLNNKGVKNVDGKDYHRLRSVRLKGQLSQGLALPLSSFPELNEEVEDISMVLGVILYEPPQSFGLQGDIKGNFPSHLVSKTDAERIQNVYKKLYSQKKTYIVSEKYDGCSISLLLHEDEFMVCSRNLSLKDTEGNLYWAMAKKYNVEELLRNEFNLNGRELAIQGEIVGPGIQGNKYKLKEPQLFIFNIYDVTNKKVLDYTDINILPSLSRVPRLGIFETDPENPLSLNDLLLWAEDKSVLGDCTREGIVLKNIESDLTLKIISNKFLLKYD